MTTHYEREEVVGTGLKYTEETSRTQLSLPVRDCSLWQAGIGELGLGIREALAQALLLLGVAFGQCLKAIGMGIVLLQLDISCPNKIIYTVHNSSFRDLGQILLRRRTNPRRTNPALRLLESDALSLF